VKSILFLIIIFVTTNGWGQSFTEVSNEVGLTYIYPGNDHQEVGAGMVVMDVNNDGWDDIFQAGGIFPSKLWINKEGTFVDASEEWGIGEIDFLKIQGGCSADYDNDGFVDLFLGNFGIKEMKGDDHPPVLLKNINGERFEWVMKETFVRKGNFPGAAWGDINNDGYVDLFLYNYTKSMGEGWDSVRQMKAYIPYCIDNVFYLNKGGKGFERYDKQLGLNDNGCGLAASFTDYDNDNDVDLILLNDFAEWNHKGNRFYENKFPELELKEIAETNGFYNEFYGMGVGPGDVDNDGYLDYYLTNIGANYLYMNDGKTLVDEADKRGVQMPFESNQLKGTSWSGLFFDVENDGDIDLFVSKGYLESFEPIAMHEENKFFLNDGRGHFTNISETSGVNDSLVQRGTGLLDFDHDGDLDIVCGVISMRRSEFGGLDQKIKLYRNDNNSKNRWIGIRLEGKDNVNSKALGCSIKFTDSEGRIHIREVGGGTGHSSQQTKTLYFGLGKDKWVKNIEIQWLDKWVKNIEIQWLGHGTTTIDKLKSNKVYSVDQSGEYCVVY
jgi:hypothetical protein